LASGVYSLPHLLTRLWRRLLLLLLRALLQRLLPLALPRLPLPLPHPVIHPAHQLLHRRALQVRQQLQVHVRAIPLAGLLLLLAQPPAVAAGALRLRLRNAAQHLLNHRRRALRAQGWCPG